MRWVRVHYSETLPGLEYVARYVESRQLLGLLVQAPWVRVNETLNGYNIMHVLLSRTYLTSSYLSSY